jgi:uncharacterized ferritin-like protein (DUF455 family)
MLGLGELEQSTIVGMECRQAALVALSLADPALKLAAVQRMAPALQGWRYSHEASHLGSHASSPEVATETDWQTFDLAHGPLPGRPDHPRLVDPRDVPHRALGTPEGRARLIHAVAHIEFNAINLALDACWRFGGMPRAYYLDWWRVATEEAMHFALVCDHLATLGHAYGDFDAHDGLWRMCEATQHDPLARMALVPRLLEARGLDVTPGMQAKLAQAGDLAAVRVLDVILRDEVGHVAVGNHWFAWLCRERGVAPQAHMRRLMAEHRAPKVRPPLNREARMRAGFSDDDLKQLLAAWDGAQPPSRR